VEPEVLVVDSDREESAEPQVQEASPPMEEEAAEVATTATWGFTSSPWGVPPRALVVHPDSRGSWGVSAGKTLAAVTEALAVRLEELRKLELPETAFLPMAAQVRAQQELQKRWNSSVLGIHNVSEVGA
jgi:hypothetical protein